MSPKPVAETHGSRLIIEVSPGKSATPNLGGLGIGKPIKLFMQQLLTDFTYLPSPSTQPPTLGPYMESRRASMCSWRANLATALPSPGHGCRLCRTDNSWLRVYRMMATISGAAGFLHSSRIHDIRPDCWLHPGLPRSTLTFLPPFERQKSAHELSAADRHQLLPWLDFFGKNGSLD